MNRTTLLKHAKRLALGLAVLAIAATPSFAQTTSYDLCATTGSVTMPDATVVPIWGYVLGSTCVAGDATLPGPELRATEGDALTITLHNNLTVPVSLVVPGYRAATTGGTPGMFTAEAAPASSVTYDVTARAGSYLYHSGTDITTQVPMGLYGALVVDVAPGQAYGDVTYGEDRVLVYSEIDANLNADPANFGGARVTTWNPQYFLINGAAHPATSDLGVVTNADVLLRFVNAGLRTFVPTLDGGLFMDLVAEDGNRYPQPLQQYGIELQAGKTIDAMVSASADGSYALYDRAASYDGAVTTIIAGAAVGAPTANDDAYSAVEDTPLVVLAADGVLFNDSADAIAAVLVSGPSEGTLDGGLASDGSFTYGPNANFSGTDTFTYKANNGAGGPNSNVATVTITVGAVNDAPVAVGNAYNAVEGETLIVAAPGVLSNDSDPDGDAMFVTTTPVVAPTKGNLTLYADGSFDYTPTVTSPDSDTFTYEVCDAEPLCATAPVYLTIVAPAANVAPFAINDFGETTKNSAGVTFSVTANDVDADGTIDATSVDIITGINTQHGGEVTNNGDGTVTYVPKRGFRGTDTFQYTVDDDEGATSNVATVRINVL